MLVSLSDDEPESERSSHVTVRKNADDVLRDRLRAAGLRATGPRVEVLKCLEASTTPLAHAEVFEQVASKGFDRATVYRNLTDLVEVGFVRRYDLGDHVWRFELLSEEGGKSGHGPDAHAHFVCSDCGTVECLPAATVALQGSRGAPKALKKAASLEIQIRGVCDRCD
jgi:Fur family ferric uptake transcriptional regulator